MKPSSAMALASRMSGHSVLACAFAGTGVVVAMVIAARAAERSRSRLVNMVPAPLQGMLVFRAVAGAEALACRQLSAAAQKAERQCQRQNSSKHLEFSSSDVCNLRVACVNGPSAVTFCGIFLREIGSNETGIDLAAREIAYSLENVHRRLHKTPLGV